MMTEAEYRALDAINWSTLSAGRTSMAHLKARIDCPRGDTESLELGRVVHCLVLEPGQFSARYAVCGKMDRRTKAGKAAWEEFVEENIGRDIIDAGDHDEARRIAESVLRNRDAMALLQDGQAEQVLTWADVDTGVRCKGRADYIKTAEIVDLKTTRDASPRKFASAAYGYGYFGQMAFYADGAEQTDGHPRLAYIIAVETSRPYVSQVYEITAADLEVGRFEYKKLLAEYNLARSCNQWPGYATKPLPLCVPRWAVASMEVRENASQFEAELYEAAPF